MAFLVAWGLLGRQQAVSDYLVPSLIGLTAWALVSATIYAVGFWRTLKKINASQIRELNRLDSELTRLRGADADLARVKLEKAEVSAELEKTRKALEPKKFDVSVKHGRRYAVWPDDLSGPHRNEFWVIVWDFTVTNRSSEPLPLECWLFFGVQPADMRYGNRAALSPPPEWVMKDMKSVLSGYPFIPSPCNIPPKTTMRGYIAVQFKQGDVLSVRNKDEARHAMDETPLWLQAHNNLTDSAQDFALNTIAMRHDMARGVKPGKGF